MRALKACAAAAGLAVLLAACEMTLEDQPKLALVCQTRHCNCVTATANVLSKRATTDVRWRKNGDAYCPEGYVLQLAEEK